MSEEGHQSPPETETTGHTSLQGTGPSKTPVQILNEHGAKTGNLPVYKLEKAEGEAHRPSFVFSVKIGDVSCTGEGPTKQAAKQQAAVAALNILKDNGKVLNVDDSQRPGPSKTPMQILIEHGTKIGSPPVYEIEKAEGEAHQPSFVFRVKIGDVSCTGEGPNKQTAKHQAAVAALKLLNIDTGIENVPGKSDSNSVAAGANKQLNSVGRLQELTVQKKLRPPVYTFAGGPPNNKEYTSTCRVEALSETAVGNSKPAAKKAAAEKMLAKLQTLSDYSEIIQGLSGLGTKTSTCASLGENTTAENQIPPAANTNTEVLGTYPMTAAKRGVCLIVNNHDFSKSEGALRNRRGTMVDKNRLHKVFEWLGFEVQTHDDCDKEEMLSLFVELSTKDHSQMDCVVCCVLSHGLEGGVYGVDGNTVKLRELMDRFDGSNCPSLVGKPKLFFIQACQGTSEQRPVDIESDSPVVDFICSDAEKTSVSIPLIADFLLAMATVPSFVSFRETANGTWFIQSLCQSLVELVPRRCDLVSILTKVNEDVSAKSDYSGKKKQMPQPSFSLRKKVVFPVPDNCPPSLKH